MKNNIFSRFMQWLCRTKQLKLFIPPIVFLMVSRCLSKNESKQIKYLQKNIFNVDTFVEAFRAIPNDLVYDEVYLEKFILEKVGLDDEFLWCYSSEMKQNSGKGLLIWQNPKQFAKYMIWLLKNAQNYSSYCEIGCRWGGTFVVICEVLRRANHNFKYAIAVDLIDKPPFIERYIEAYVQKTNDNNGVFEVIYFQGSSRSGEFARLIDEKKPEIAFIDGDHHMFGTLQDHVLMRKYASVIVHHDIHSDLCEDVTLLWTLFKNMEEDRATMEFIEQYPEIHGKYFGIGVLYKNKN